MKRKPTPEESAQARRIWQTVSRRYPRWKAQGFTARCDNSRDTAQEKRCSQRGSQTRARLVHEAGRAPMKRARVRLSPEDTRMALRTGMIEPDGTDESGETIYRLTRQGDVLTKITPEHESKPS